MELALLKLAIDSKLRPCDLLRMRVRYISSSGIIHPRFLFMQCKNAFGCSVGEHWEILPESALTVV